MKVLINKDEKIEKICKLLNIKNITFYKNDNNLNEKYDLFIVRSNLKKEIEILINTKLKVVILTTNYNPIFLWYINKINSNCEVINYENSIESITKIIKNKIEMIEEEKNEKNINHY